MLFSDILNIILLFIGDYDFNFPGTREMVKDINLTISENNLSYMRGGVKEIIMSIMQLNSCNRSDRLFLPKSSKTKSRFLPRN